MNDEKAIANSVKEKLLNGNVVKYIKALLLEEGAWINWQCVCCDKCFSSNSPKSVYLLFGDVFVCEDCINHEAVQ